MTTATVDAASEALKDCLEPTRKALHDTVRTARRAMLDGRHAAEDFAMASALQVRRRPLTSIALAGAVGILAGCLVGLALGRRTRVPPIG